MEHLIDFQVFTTNAKLSAFLLENRFVRVQAQHPDLRRVLVRVSTGNDTLKPHHIVTFACLLEEYHRAGIALGFELTDCVAGRYLTEIQFTALWGATPSEPADFLFPTDQTAFALWRVEREQMTAYVYGVYRHYKAALLADKDLSGLVTFLSEIFNNIFDHAFSEGATERVAFAMVQYYPSRGRLFLAAADFGMGIPASVNRFLQGQHKADLTPRQAVAKALEPHFTTHSYPHNQGRGLPTLRTGVAGLKGTLTLLTSHLIYHVGSTGKEIYYELPEINFPGTTLQIRLFKDKLPVEELEILEDDVTSL